MNIKDFFKENIVLKVYAIACAGLLSFFVYSAYTGYKWFAPQESKYAPGGPSGMNHK